MRGLLVSVVLATVMSATPPVGGVAGFGDVDSETFFTDPVQWMVDNAITTGIAPTCFGPGDPVTRGQAAAFMWRMQGFPPSGPAHPFGDVVAPWQQDPVSWMFNNAITTGTTATTYSPDDNLTRGQLAALLHRLEGSPAAPPPIQFPDVVKVWQITPVGWMLQEGITTGTSSTTFSPDDMVTRGQLAAFFYRFKGSPPVVVDPNHPAVPACAAQVDGPATMGALVIDKDTTLLQNHTGHFSITADNITLDCAGHTITGTEPNESNPRGIEIYNRTGVTVKNCRLIQAEFTMGDSDGNTLSNNMTEGRGAGFNIINSDNNTFDGNTTIDGNSFGLNSSTGNTFTGNTVRDAGTGFNIFFASVGNTFTGNTLRDNLVGIADDSTGGSGTAGTDNTYSQNTCIGNDIASNPPGLC